MVSHVLLGALVRVGPKRSQTGLADVWQVSAEVQELWEGKPPLVGISVLWYIYNQRVSGIFKKEEPKKGVIFCCCSSMKRCCGCWVSRKSPPLTRTFVLETPWSKIAEQDELSEQRKCTMEVLLKLTHHCDKLLKN